MTHQVKPRIGDETESTQPIRRKPTIKKFGFLWVCEGAGCAAKGKSTTSAYANWFRALVLRESKHLRAYEDMRAEHETAIQRVRQAHQEEMQRLRQEAQKFRDSQLGRDIPDEWIVRRINFYNQRCIEHIWGTKTLPTEDQYRLWTIEDPSKRSATLRGDRRK